MVTSRYRSSTLNITAPTADRLSSSTRSGTAGRSLVERDCLEMLSTPNGQGALTKFLAPPHSASPPGGAHLRSCPAAHVAQWRTRLTMSVEGPIRSRQQDGQREAPQIPRQPPPRNNEPSPVAESALPQPACRAREPTSPATQPVATPTRSTARRFSASAGPEPSPFAPRRACRLSPGEPQFASLSGRMLSR